VHLEKVETLDGVVRAKSELIAALPPGGTAIVPAGFPVCRDDIVVVRIGEGVVLESFEPPLLRTSIGSAEVNFSAQHLAQNALVFNHKHDAHVVDIPF
jgi:UDP-N-acetylmuramyl pentapeptide synthase